jgi:long-chain fatty acid transport protein
MGDVTWTNWGAFDRVTLVIDAIGGTQVEAPTNFEDTWSFSLGAHFRPADRWLLMFGGSYTTSAVDDADRSPALPTDQQVRVSLGLEYEINESWRVGGNYTYAWLGDNRIDTRLPGFGGRIQGDYDTGAHFLGIYASYRF